MRAKTNKTVPLTRYMSANNRRIRRIIVDLLWEHGPQTRNQLADLLLKERGIREIPSDTSLSSLLSKNVQVETVDNVRVENINGSITWHMAFDIRRDLITEKEHIIYTRPPSCMTGSQRKKTQRCPDCGRNRLFPPDSTVCFICV